jgi:hypothetical protein
MGGKYGQRKGYCEEKCQVPEFVNFGMEQGSSLVHGTALVCLVRQGTCTG